MCFFDILWLLFWVFLAQWLHTNYPNMDLLSLLLIWVGGSLVGLIIAAILGGGKSHSDGGI